MLLSNREIVAGNLSRSIPVTIIDDAAIERARRLFGDYQRRGVVLNENFDDVVWTLCDEVRRVKLQFKIMKTEPIPSWTGYETEQYLLAVRTYLVFTLGSFSLIRIQGICRNLLSLFTISEPEDIDEAANTLRFLKMLPDGSAFYDSVIEMLEDRCEVESETSALMNQRVLAAFDSYIRFDEELAEFWRFASSKQRLFYFPVYLWWNLTAILPLRVTEFLLTPRNCLSGNMITIRRTKLKGGNRQVLYRVSEDYEMHRYELSTELADAIRQYISDTEAMEANEIGTLFVLPPHYEYMDVTGILYNRYYTYNNLETCLRKLLPELSNYDAEKYGRIRPGDTRHIAMIGLIISGGSPVICRELAGHASIDISSHYYSNISTLIECVTLERFRKSKGGSAELVGEQKYALTVPSQAFRVSGGWCDAVGVENGDIAECLKVIDDHGRIGVCSSCRHYLDDEQGVRLNFFDENLGKQRVDADSAFLMRMVESVRAGIGCQEDIGSALLKLQHSCNHYADCLTAKREKEEVA